MVFIVFWIFNKKTRNSFPLIHLDDPCDTIIFSNQNSDQIYVTLKFKNSGVLYNSDRQHGISPLISKLLLRKIGELSPEETEEKIRQLGVTSLSLNGSSDDFLISFSVIESQFEPAVKFLLSGLKAKFSENDLAWAKVFFPTQINIENSLPNEILIDALHKKLYPNHVYGKNLTGSSLAITTITLDDIHKFIKNNFAMSNLKIYCAGNCSKEKLKILTDELSKFLPKQSNQNNIPSLKNIAVDNSDKKILNDNIKDICGITTGIRLDALSQQEKSALLIIADTLFNGDNGEFLSDKFPMNFSYAIEDRDLSSVLILSSFVQQEDSDKYLKKINDFLSNLDLLQLKNFESSRNYFIKKQNLKISSLRFLHNSLNFLSMPFSGCSNEIYKQVLDKIKQPKTRCTVIISSK